MSFFFLFSGKSGAIFVSGCWTSPVRPEGPEPAASFCSLPTTVCCLPRRILGLLDRLGFVFRLGLSPWRTLHHSCLRFLPRLPAGRSGRLRAGAALARPPSGERCGPGAGLVLPAPERQCVWTLTGDLSCVCRFISLPSRLFLVPPCRSALGGRSSRTDRRKVGRESSTFD